MEQTTTFQFSWNSPIGVSVIIFLLMNFIYLLVGIFPPILFRFFGNLLSVKLGLVFSPASDVAAFGKNAIELMKENPSALVIKTTFYDVITGLYLAHAILHFCLIWFCLIRGQTWSFWALTFSDLAVIGFYLLAARNLSTHLAPLKFGNLMPFATVPGILLPFAVIFGYIGLYWK